MRMRLRARGATFKQLCKMTDIFEGSIIRATRRLDELMRQLADAMSIILNKTLVSAYLTMRMRLRARAPRSSSCAR